MVINSKENKSNVTVTIFPKAYDKAFPNPLKGFRASSVKAEDYPTLTRLYIKWNEIENNENDGIEKIINYCNRQWENLPENNSGRPCVRRRRRKVPRRREGSGRETRRI